jgi:hypothetical protein
VCHIDVLPRAARLDPSATQEGESTDHIDHIDHARRKLKQKQLVSDRANVIGPKSRPITSITAAKNRNENRHIENRACYRFAAFRQKVGRLSSEKCETAGENDPILHLIRPFSARRRASQRLAT